MDFLVRNLIEQYKTNNGKLRLHNKKYAVPAIILCLLSILIEFLLVIYKDIISASFAWIFLLISVLMLIGVEILVTVNNHEYYSSKVNAQNQRKNLYNTLQLLNKNEFLSISSKEEIQTVKDEVCKYYNSKFAALLKIKQYTYGLFKIILFPILLAIINYLLNGNDNISFIQKIVYIIFLIFCSLTFMWTIYILFDIAKLIIEVSNVYCKLLLDDLEFLSHFHIQDDSSADMCKCTEASETKFVR